MPRLHLFLSLPKPTAAKLKQFCAKTGLKKNAVVMQSLDKFLDEQSPFDYWHPIVVDTRSNAWINGKPIPKRKEKRSERRQTKRVNRRA